MKFIQKIVDKELFGTYWWLIGLAFKHARWLSTGYLFFACVQLIANLASYFLTARVSAYLVDVIAGKRESSDVWPVLALTITAGLIAYTSYRVMDIYYQLIYYELAKLSSRMYFTQLCRMDMSDFYDPDVRNEINRINSGYTWQIPNSATQSLSILHSTVNTAATIVTIGIVAWWIIPLFVVLLLPYFIYESKLAKISWFVWDEKSDEQHIFWGLQSIFTQAKEQFEIRALTASRRLLRMSSKLSNDFYERQQHKFSSLHWMAAVSVLLQVVREGGAQVWLVTQAVGKKLSLEQYFFYMTMVFRLDGAISGLFTSFARIQEGLKYSTDYRKFMTREPKLVDIMDAVQLDKTLPPFFEFVDATFTYPGTDKPAFKNLNLRVESGQKVALVGENGAGKSTIIKLLMRFYRLDSGTLLINGVNIQDIAIESWFNQVATLFQDFNHYPLPVTDNIAISGSKTDMKLVKQAATLSGADTYIKGLPHGYDTYLNPSFEKGVEPSGGLWQRIALARAFYRDASMIILDEPTSAIDAKAEYDIFNNIFERHDGKTALIVSHRFSTVRKADRVVVLNGGKIVEDGTHKELLKLDGLYAEMFNKQAEGYR